MVGWQTVVTALLVLGCAVYALRSLWPRAWWPRSASRMAAGKASSACGGCDACAPAPATGGAKAIATPQLSAGESVIRIVRRQPSG